MSGENDRPENPTDDDTAEASGETPDAETPAAEGRTADVAERVYTQPELDAAVAVAAEESKNRYLRLAAEYDNFRRRVQREKEQYSAEAIERFAADLLSVLDDFDRALAAKSDGADPVVEGIRLTDKKLRATLSRHGIECVDPAGQKFDPKFHEAVQRVPPGDKAPGTVVAVFEKGYTLKGRLLRPARVQVAGEN
jgi:molecular chaperone GrpE